jgi:hypothetical protein
MKIFSYMNLSLREKRMSKSDLDARDKESGVCQTPATTKKKKPACSEGAGWYSERSRNRVIERTNI